MVEVLTSLADEFSKEGYEIEKQDAFIEIVDKPSSTYCIVIGGGLELFLSSKTIDMVKFDLVEPDSIEKLISLVRRIFNEQI